jgi:hypothetical protein
LVTLKLKESLITYRINFRWHLSIPDDILLRLLVLLYCLYPLWLVTLSLDSSHLPTLGKQSSTITNCSIFFIDQVDLLGLELLTSAFGILTFLRGVAALLGPPLAGFVIDATSKQSITTVLGEYKVKY